MFLKHYDDFAKPNTYIRGVRNFGAPIRNHPKIDRVSPKYYNPAYGNIAATFPPTTLPGISGMRRRRPQLRAAISG